MIDHTCDGCGEKMRITAHRRSRSGSRPIFCSKSCRHSAIAETATAPFTAELVKSLVTYDATTGIFTWREARPHCHPGDPAGHPHSSGYVYVTLRKKKYLAHKLAWFVTFGKWEEVDHRNGVRADNRLINLRESTRSQNNANAEREDNKHGLRGVVFAKKERRWYAQISVNNVRRRWGRFLTKEEAHEAYKKAHIEAHGDRSYYSRPAQ